MQLTQALTQPQCPPQLLEQGVRWATLNTSTTHADADNDEREWIERACCIVAALVMRDGSPELKLTHGDWALEQLVQKRRRGQPDDTGVPEASAMYNAAAIAAVGFLAASRNDAELADL